MDKEKKTVVILMAEDDDDDYMLTKEAFKESRLLNPLYRVKDGEELMDYLLHRGKFQNPEDAPRPGIILLDLNILLSTDRCSGIAVSVGGLNQWRRHLLLNTLICPPANTKKKRTHVRKLISFLVGMCH